MKQVEVFYGKSYKTVSQKNEKDLQWYDTVKKEMQTFKGGQLKFEYNFEEQRMLPKVEEIIKKNTVFKSNKDDFNKWYNNYKINSDIVKMTENNDSVIFNVPEYEFEDFVDGLDRERYEYT